jgi:hypothetical protein
MLNLRLPTMMSESCTLVSREPRSNGCVALPPDLEPGSAWLGILAASAAAAAVGVGVVGCESGYSGRAGNLDKRMRPMKMQLTLDLAAMAAAMGTLLLLMMMMQV